MFEYLQKLFLSDFMPHGHCYMWKPEILWVHVASDALTAMAYYSIPAAIVYFVLNRKDFVFNWIFVLFAVFIFSCGSTHLMGIWTTWNGTYRLEGIVKATTAITSVLTAIVVWPLIPKALQIPSKADLQNAYDELEQRVDDRTLELAKSKEVAETEASKLRDFHETVVDRELAMIELKKEVNALLVDMGRPGKYQVE